MARPLCGTASLYKMINPRWKSNNLMANKYSEENREKPFDINLLSRIMNSIELSAVEKVHCIYAKKLPSNSMSMRPARPAYSLP